MLSKGLQSRSEQASQGKKFQSCGATTAKALCLHGCLQTMSQFATAFIKKPFPTKFWAFPYWPFSLLFLSCPLFITPIFFDIINIALPICSLANNSLGTNCPVFYHSSNDSSWRNLTESFTPRFVQPLAICKELWAGQCTISSARSLKLLSKWAQAHEEEKDTPLTWINTSCEVRNMDRILHFLNWQQTLGMNTLFSISSIAICVRVGLTGGRPLNGQAGSWRTRQGWKETGLYTGISWFPKPDELLHFKLILIYDIFQEFHMDHSDITVTELRNNKSIENCGYIPYVKEGLQLEYKQKLEISTLRLSHLLLPPGCPGTLMDSRLLPNCKQVPSERVQLHWEPV